MVEALRAWVIRWPDGSIDTGFDFSWSIVNGIKSLVPPGARSFDGETKVWCVDFEFVGRHEQAEPEPQPIRRDDDAYRELHLLPSAPPELVTAAYKTLARLHHPDVGGDTATMQRLNDAFAKLMAGAS